jgi:catechol 2,3-dioxygenase-like lactoylglutathione lyase family enzyme
MSESSRPKDEDDLVSSPSVSIDPTESDLTHISEMRLIIECADWDQAIAFYRDALGLRQIQGYQGDTEAQMILDVGRATIELVHPELPKIDSGKSAELSAPPVPKVRLAFRTSRAQAVIERLEEVGAERVEGPKLNSSETLNVRLTAPDHMPITVFRPLGDSEFAESAK